MGANYDMILSAGASQPQVIDSVRVFLQRQGYSALSVIGYDSFRENRPAATDMVCFVGPQRDGVWLPMVANCSTLRVSLRDWFTLNPLARHLSVSARATIYLWCFDSGFAAGYTLFLQGKRQAAQTVFSRSITQRESELIPGVPVPPDYQGKTSLGTVLNKPDFDYGEFMARYVDLEDATAALVASLGVLEHLCDFDHLARGMDAVAVNDGRSQPIALSPEWVVIPYERSTTT
jgi:hypothetical protein